MILLWTFENSEWEIREATCVTELVKEAHIVSAGIHSNACIHTTNRAVLTSLRGARRGLGSQLHNLFFPS